MVQLLEGDRIQEDNGEQTVVTPFGDTPHNFGPASARDSTVYTCERPGGDTKEGKINTKAKVDEWIKFMTTPERNIKHVVILLSDKELEAYEEPGLISAYEAGGITVHHIPYASEGSFQKIMETLDNVHEKGERVVAHCTHGMGRSGRVAAGWLAHRYQLEVDTAVEEALAEARKYGVERMGSPVQLGNWIAEGA